MSERVPADVVITTEPHPTMPPEIAKAIIAVNKQVKSLAKDENNKYANFRYASVDAFYEAIGPLMAEAGLFVLAEEVSSEIERRETIDDRGQVKSSNWLSTNYELTLYHESGVGWGPVRRSMMVAASGPQAYGAGQSYVEKYFLRGLFKVPTSEGDADGHQQEGLPSRRPVPPLRQEPPRRPAAVPVRINGHTLPPDDPEAAQARDVYMKLVKAITDAKLPQDVDRLLFKRDEAGNLTDEQTDEFALIDRHSGESAKHVINCAKARKQELRASA